jgi:hypothetical protein
LNTLLSLAGVVVVAVMKRRLVAGVVLGVF